MMAGINETAVEVQLRLPDIQPEPTAVRMAVLACQGLINRQVSIDHIQHLDSFTATGGE